MEFLANYISQYGVLASYRYAQLLAAYYDLYDKPDTYHRCKASFNALMQDIHCCEGDFKYIENLTKEDLAKHLYDFITNLDFFDEMFSILFEATKVDLKSLIVEQKVNIISHMVALNLHRTRASLINQDYKYFAINGFSLFIFLAKNLDMEPEKIVDKLHYLLLQPYIRPAVIKNLGFSNLTEVHVVEDIATDQLIIYNIFDGKVCNPVIFLPLNDKIEPMLINFFDSEIDNTILTEKIERAFIYNFEPCNIQEYLAWIFNKMWLADPIDFIRKGLCKIKKAGLYETQFSLYLPTDKSVRYFLVNIMDTVFNREELNTMQIKFLQSQMSNNIYFGFYKSLNDRSRYYLINFYVRNTVWQLGSIAEKYLVNKHSLQYTTLKSRYNANCLALFNSIKKQFIKYPTVEDLAVILAYLKNNDDYDASDIFCIVNAIAEHLVTCLGDWFEFTKYTTGYVSHQLKSISDTGVYTVNITFEGETTLTLTGAFPNEKLYYDNHFIVTGNISDETMYEMLPGIFSTSSIPLHSELDSDAYEVPECAYLIDTEKLCIFPITNTGTLIKDLCKSPYEINYDIDTQTLHIADRDISFVTKNNTNRYLVPSNLANEDKVTNLFI